MDVLIGGARDDQLFGGTGNDILAGDSGTREQDGNDFLVGGDGADLLIGEGGRDRLDGGAGDDQLAGDHSGTDPAGDADEIYAGDGNDRILGQGGDDYIDAGADNDLVAGGTGADTILGGDGDDQLQGGEEADTLYGGAGTNTLFGESGNDVLQGGIGTDYVFGGIGDDTVDGGEGNDVYYYAVGEGNDHIADSGGTDWLVFQDINFDQLALGVGSLKISVPGGEIHLDDFDPDNPLAAGGIEYFQFADSTVVSKAQLIATLGFTPTGTPDADALSGTALADVIQSLAGDDSVDARAGNDTVYAGDGNDAVHAGDGSDTVYGGAGNDFLAGDAGADIIHGGGGNDTLAGGGGSDSLFGGEGDDVYLFKSGDGFDTASDAIGQNIVQLETGLTLAGIVFSRQGSDLLIAIKGTADRLTAKDWFAADTHFAGVKLGDGQLLDRATVEAAMPRNLAPAATPDAVVVEEDSILLAAGNALVNDSDPEGRPLQVTNSGSYSGSFGSLLLGPDGAYVYELANGTAAVQSLGAAQRASETFSYTVTDNDPTAPAVAESSIVVTVLGSNDLPLLGDDSAQTTEDSGAIGGNVLTNDWDADAGTVLTVSGTGLRGGSYGELSLASDGTWAYELVDSGSGVQNLRLGQTLADIFPILVSDGLAAVAGNLSIKIMGQNDIPVLVAALADQAAAPNKQWRWQVPAGSFLDVDSGDVLNYRATLADGTALPSWLTFDPAIQTFAGRVPRTATGSIDIRVTAADSLGAEAADVFSLAFSGGTGGGGGGSNGNEGVGNGVDGPPPGHDSSLNDGPGTSPGNPGARGGLGYAPTYEDLLMHRIVISVETMPGKVVAHGKDAYALLDARGQVNKNVMEPAFGSHEDEPLQAADAGVTLVGSHAFADVA